MADNDDTMCSIPQGGGGSYDTDGAAEYVGCSAGHLAKLRGTGDGPRYYRLFKRKGVIYEQPDLDQWKASRRFGSTSEYPEQLR